MKNSIQYFTENGIPELEKIKMNFMENPAVFDKCVEEVWKVFLQTACQCHEVKKSANIFIIDVLLYFQMHSAVKLYFSSVSRLEYTGVIFLGMANRQNPILPI